MPQPDTTGRILYDTAGAADKLSLSTDTVRREMRSGNLRAVRYGNKPLFHIDELQRFASTLAAWEPA